MNAPVTAPAGSVFALENRRQLEKSFKDFAARPENKPLLEQRQKEEVAAALQLQEYEQQLQLQQQVQDLHPRDAKLLAPVLQSAVLRQLLISLASHKPEPSPTTPPANHPESIVAAALPAAKGDGSSSNNMGGGGLKAWMENPRVLQLLREANTALMSGRLAEEQLAAVLRQQVQALQQSPGAGEPQAAPHQAKLPSHLLVEALNEHLAERQAGNTAYKQHQYETAMQHYQRALAVVNFVVGSNADDQAEVQHNKAAVLLNIAAVHMTQEEWGAAVACCDDVLRAQQQGELAMKAWLRRSKANLGRHEYEAALRDLSQVQARDPWNEELPVLRATVMHAQKDAAQHTDKMLAAKMFRMAAGPAT